MGELSQLVFWVVWGAGTPIVYGLLLRKRRRHYLRHHDRRAFRDTMESFGYFLVALAACAGVTVGLLGPPGGIGRILFAIASAFYFVVGVYALLESQPDNGATGQARRQ